jgi:hypothetical protein
MTGPDLGRRHCLGILAAAAPVALTVALAGCDGSGPGAARDRRPAASAVQSRSRQVASPAGVGLRAPATWLLTRQALTMVAASPVVRAGLARAQVLELLQPGQQPAGLAGALPAVGFRSASVLARAVDAGQLPAGTTAVLYDPEAWSFTPRAEQRDPEAAARQAATAAGKRGLRLILTPALNLVTVLAPGSAGPRWRQFLDLQLAAKLAPLASILELQAQSLERDAAAYASFVTAAAAQARAANPDITLLAGLSTNPPGDVVTGGQLVAAIRATRGVVDGYWLNIPGRGPQCPTCRQMQPQVGIDALAGVL